MTTTPERESDIERRLRAALSARADLVQPERLAPLAPVVPLRPRWRSPWVVLATAAVMLLVLGVVLQGLGRDPRSDDVAPSPDGPRVELPDDVGRGWEPTTLSRTPRLDLDGDGTDEKVTFRGEPTEGYDGRLRIETTLSSTGEEAYGIAEVGTTLDSNALDPIDADGDGDQELVLYFDDASAVAGGGHPLVFDLRDGLLVQAVPQDPDLLRRGQVPVPGSRTEHYEMVRIHDYWFEDGTLWSSRSVNAYAAGNMTLLRPETVVVDAWTWTLDDAGVLQPDDAGCLRVGLESTQPCGDDTADELPYVSPVADDTFGAGGSAVFDVGYRFTARLEAGDPATLVIEGEDGRTLRHPLDVTDPRVSTTQPTSVMSDGASFYVTSAADPSYAQVLVQDGDVLRALRPTGEVELADDDTTRTWLTSNGALVTAVAGDGGTWRTWLWQMVSGTEMAALPSATVCFDDPEDPATVRRC
ncbi:hypothetical protein [Nocardioides pinisoli]|uniref:VCBS repeat-containing protein n=1 Tax=Nocardioides pinisoli TaxID=2950279 RepID=A0ABT1KWL7_9ACTN|nr:hypothetical protein [Nocardioides pinisoli]MCP3422155.1 hypothetical protein [Nocardioides pinisoli]